MFFLARQEEEVHSTGKRSEVKGRTKWKERGVTRGCWKREKERAVKLDLPLAY